jgi:hypothetical protein
VRKRGNAGRLGERLEVLGACIMEALYYYNRDQLQQRSVRLTGTSL